MAQLARHLSCPTVLMPVIDEAVLIQRAKVDPTAFGTLYRAHVDRIYNYVYHRVGDPLDAEDLTARTFQRALASMSSYEDIGLPYAAWLFRIAHNVVANWLRDRQRHQVVPLDVLDHVLADQPVDEQMADAKLLLAEVRKEVGRMDADRQTLLVLKFSQGLSNAEIALVLGRSEGAVKSLYHRTLLDLRSALASAESIP